MTAVTCVTNHLLVYRHLVVLRLAQHEYVGPGLADIITLPRALFTPRYLQLYLCSHSASKWITASPGIISLGDGGNP